MTLLCDTERQKENENSAERGDEQNDVCRLSALVTFPSAYKDLMDSALSHMEWKKKGEARRDTLEKQDGGLMKEKGNKEERTFNSFVRLIRKAFPLKNAEYIITLGLILSVLSNQNWNNWNHESP